ncbi:MAG: putative delta-60 repeat protein [Desulforhopalus sp.]|jgi:uncharacterized delta-60 repeat protein
MWKTNLSAGIVILIFCTFFPFSTMARTQIDTSFGDAGASLQDFKIGNDEAHAIAVQDDGKILVAGYSSNGAVKDLIVSRFTENGTLDSDFNSAGIFTRSLGSGDTIGRSLAIQEDGKIIVGGSTYDGEAKVAVLRLTTDGFLDSSFAGDGYLILSVDEGEIVSTGVQLTSTGDIAVAATITPESSASYAFFAKINSEGQLDDSFSDDGQSSYKDGTNNIVVNTLTILSDDKILAGGSFTEGTVTQAGLLKINTDGSIDTTYATDGRSSLALGGTSSVIHSSALDSDGNVIVAGAINNGEYDEAFVAKIKDDGSVATDFASSGIYKTTYSVENVVYSVSLQGDDSISAVGFITLTTGKDIFVLTLRGNPETQTTAITYIATDIAKNDDVAYAAITLEDDILLAAGSSSNGEDLDVALLRFTEDPTLSSAAPTSSVDGITTSGFRITTQPVTAITRVGAMTGGTIVDNTPGTCAERCTSQCIDITSTCFSSCTANCEDGVTIVRRGIVYGTEPNPEYAPDEDTEEDGTDSETTTTASDTETDSDTETTTSTGSIFPSSDSTGSIFPDSITFFIVRLGNTDDGEGEGQYTTEISNMTPGTRYYLRAYAVLSNGEVIYGNEYTLTTEDSCFIATAAYGSILEKHVVLLRQFRDDYLLTNSIGQRFVALYYHFSPPIADKIRENATLQTIARIALFPAVLLALFFVKTTLITKIICIAIGLPGILLLGFKHFTSHQVTTT